jgi:hypothetical protein
MDFKERVLLSNSKAEDAMKDAAHHRVHVQKKVIQSIRREEAKAKENGTEASNPSLVGEAIQKSQIVL